MAPEKKCLYEILGLSRDCSPDEIRSAYKKLALQRHPDKLIQTGVPEEEATAAFQELVGAYEVLSDPRERAWYDSHRSQILFSDANSSGSKYSQVPDLFSFFSNSVYSGFGDTGKGFYKVYGDLFGKVYSLEVSFAQKLGLGLGAVRDAPLMGNLGCPYTQVTAFYNYWLGFGTVLDFCWVDEYDVLSGPNRKSRRLMEEENKKLRKKARKEYNDTVRGLAEFVKKRDKRVIEMQMKRTQEQAKKKEEEMIRKKEAQQAKLAKAMLYEEPAWAKIDEEPEDGFDEPEDDEKQNNRNELYCVVCNKKFKSEKQWKNHEQSKKHRDKVAQLRETLDAEDELYVDGDNGGNDNDNDNDDEKGPVDGDEVEAHGNLHEEETMAELEEQFEDTLDFQEEAELRNPSSPGKGNKVSDASDQDEVSQSFGSDEETDILEAMVSGHIKNRKTAARRHEPNSYEACSSFGSEETDFMDYHAQKSTQRNRRAKGENDKKAKGEVANAELNKTTEEEIPVTSGSNIGTEEVREDRNTHMQETLSHPPELIGTNGTQDMALGTDPNALKQTVDRKGVGRKDANAKSKKLSKGKNQKATSKRSGNTCETCGENFESRTKLHTHLGETGHATMKLR